MPVNTQTHATMIKAVRVAIMKRFMEIVLCQRFMFEKHRLTTQHLFNIENPALRGSEYNGFAGTGASFFGVLEYWSTGVLVIRKARI